VAGVTTTVGTTVRIVAAMELELRSQESPAVGTANGDPSVERMRGRAAATGGNV
jgi:hypothetical protein